MDVALFLVASMFGWDIRSKIVGPYHFVGIAPRGTPITHPGWSVACVSAEAARFHCVWVGSAWSSTWSLIDP